MKTINTKFINFWSDFNDLQCLNYWKYIFKHPNINWISDRNKPFNLLVSSVFNESINEIKNFDGTKILYTRENLNNTPYRIYQNNLNLFDLIIGFNDINNQINFPYYYNALIEYELTSLNHVLDLSIKRKNICLISRNPHELRLSLIESFKQKQYQIDCPGSVGKNMTSIGQSGLDKRDFIKNYYFNICPENSYADGYITEKLFDCCISGCVPIYYGCELLNDGFYNKNRILHIKQDLSNYNEIIDKTIYLLTHKKQLLDFMNQDPFTINKQDYINNIEQKIQKNLEQILLNLN